MVNRSYRPPQSISLTHSSTQRFFKIAQGENGALQYQAGTAPFTASQIYSGRFSLESVNANIDVPISFQNWRGGAGYVEAELSKPGLDEVYHYSRGVDLSWPNRMYLSPQLQTGAAVTSSTPLKFVRSTLGLFAFNTRYIYEWASSTWTERWDMGAGASITDMLQYSNTRGTYLVVCLAGQPPMWSVDGIQFFSGTSNTVPSIRATSTANTAGATSLAVTKPTGTAENDILLAQIIVDNVTSYPTTIPSGWTEIGYNFTTNMHIYFWKRAGASEGASYTWGWTGSNPARITITAVQNAQTTGSPFDDVDGRFGSGDAIPLTAAVNVLGPDRLAVISYVATTGGGSAISATSPSGFTEQTDSASTPHASVHYDATVSAGTLAATTGAFSTTAETWDTHIWIIKPTTSYPTDMNRLTVRGALSGEPVLWAVDDDGDVRSTTDITDSASWSAADSIQVGQASSTIAGFETIGNVMYFVTDNGIDTYDGVTSERIWDSGSLKIDTARTFVWVDNRLYFAFSGALLRLLPENNVIEQVWPRGGQKGNPELNGKITAIGGDSLDMYFVLQNNAGNNYVMKGDPRQPLTINGESIYPFHTWAYRSTGDASAILVVDGASDTMHATNPHLVIGDDNSADYFILPRPNYRPEDDSNYRFDTAEGTVTGSWVDAGARTYSKWLNRGRSINEGISASGPATYVALNYEIDASGTPVQIHQASANGITSTSLTSSEIAFGRVRYSVDMDTDTATSSPRNLGVVLNATLNPTRKRMWVITVEIADLQQNQAGGRSSQGIDALRSHLFGALNNRCTFVDRDGSSYVVHVEIQGVDAAKRLGAEERYTLQLTEI